MIFLDIETIPLDEARARLTAKVEAPKALKKPESIAAWEEREREPAEEEAFRKGSFNAIYGRVLIVSAAIDDEPVVSFAADDEKDLLEQLAAWWPKDPETIAGHNVLDFDLLFLWQRAKILGVRLPAWFPKPNTPAWKCDVFDTMLEWSGRYGNKPKLDDLCYAFAVKSPKAGELDGSKVYDYWREGRWDELIAYSQADVEAVREVYWRMV